MASIEPHKSPNAALGIIDPEWEAFCQNYGHLIPKVQGTKQIRDDLAALKARSKAAAPTNDGLTITHSHVPAADGHKVPVRIYTPTGNDLLPRAGVLSIHGGGWTAGNLESDDLICRALCLQTNVVALNVDYRLAPENPFPTPLEDCWSVLLWAIENAPSLGIDKNALTIVGTSAGANITAVLSHRLRDQGINLRAQILRCPATCHPDAYPAELKLHSMKDFEDAPVLSAHAMNLFYSNYAAPDPHHPDLSPLLAPNFKGLAPAYFQIAGRDPLRDEGLAYAEKLRQAGITTKVDVYPGLPHTFSLFPMLSAAKTSLDDLVNSVKLINGNGLADNSVDKSLL